MSFQTIIAIFVSAGAALALWTARGLLTARVPTGGGQRVATVLTVSGSAPELESTVAGLRWLIRNGTLNTRVIIADAGMDEETRAVAELLAGGDGGVWLCSTENVADYLK